MTSTRRYLRASAAVLAATFTVLAGCASGGGASGSRSPSGAPESFFQTADSTATMRVIDLRADLSRDSLWTLVTTALDRRYTLESSTKATGLAQTTWRNVVDAAGIPDLRYRRRVIVQFLGADWRRLQVRSEATWEALTGYDRDFLIEAMADLRARAGRG